MRRSILTMLVALAALALLAVPAAGGDQQLQRHAAQAQDQRALANPNFRVIGDDVADSPVEIHGMHGMQHGAQTICRARARTSRCSARWTSTTSPRATSPT